MTTTSLTPAPVARRAPLALAATLALVLAGCGSLTRSPGAEPPPATAVPATWAVAPASASSGASAASAASAPAALELAEWQDWVRDDRLRQVIARSLEHNRDLRVALLTMAQARAAYDIQDAARGPTVNATGGLSASRTPAQASSSGQTVNTRTYSVGLGVSAWELDFFGRVQSLADSALASYLQTEAAQRSTRLSLIGDVATAWLTLAADRQQAALARRTLDSQRETYRLTAGRKEAGAVSGLTLAQARTSVESARVSLAAADSQVQRDRYGLELLVGQTLPDALLPPEDLGSGKGDGTGSTNPGSTDPGSTALVAVPAGLPSTVLQRRPDVVAAEQQLRGAQADLAAARAALYPRISLTASAGTASRELGTLFQGGAWSFAPSISLPILDGGAARASVRRAEIASDLRLASYDKVLQTAFKEVADALSVRASLAERLDAQRALVDAAQRSLDLAMARQQAGADSFLTVLDAQRTLLSAQQGLITLQLTEAGNRVTLYKVLGGSYAQAVAVTASAVDDSRP